MNTTPFHEDPQNPPTCEYWEEFMTCRCPCKREVAPPGEPMNPYFQKLVAAANAPGANVPGSAGEMARFVLHGERAKCPHPFPLQAPCRICGSTPHSRP